MQFKSFTRFFHFTLRDFKKGKLRELFFQSSVTPDDYQYFLETIIQSRPILPKLLSVLYASVFVFTSRLFLC